MKRLYIILGLIAVIVSATGVYAYNVNKEIGENIIRLHILANSNNVYDQKIKYLVRDKVIENYNFESEDIKEQYKFLKENLDNIKDYVDNYLMELGVDYQCKVTLSEDVFPTKSYGNLKLPHGKYTALKIILGNGDGKNWWCVMFPPMCFTESMTGMIDEKSNEYLKNNLSSGSYSLITDDNIQIRFKIVEMYNKIF